jgi:hypothetical protein
MIPWYRCLLVPLFILVLFCLELCEILLWVTYSLLWYFPYDANCYMVSFILLFILFRHVSCLLMVVFLLYLGGAVVASCLQVGQDAEL